MSVYNFHGVPKSDKRDIPERTKQTARVLEIMEKDPNKKILVGDFNLRPDTKALQAFGAHMRDLIKENGVSTTRSHFYEHKATSPYADYAFISPEIGVKHFEVLTDEVSDHLALLVEVEIGS